MENENSQVSDKQKACQALDELYEILYKYPITGAEAVRFARLMAFVQHLKSQLEQNDEKEG